MCADQTTTVNFAEKSWRLRLPRMTEIQREICNLWCVMYHDKPFSMNAFFKHFEINHNDQQRSEIEYAVSLLVKRGIVGCNKSKTVFQLHSEVSDRIRHVEGFEGVGIVPTTMNSRSARFIEAYVTKHESRKIQASPMLSEILEKVKKRLYPIFDPFTLMVSLLEAGYVKPDSFDKLEPSASFGQLSNIELKSLRLIMSKYRTSQFRSFEAKNELVRAGLANQDRAAQDIFSALKKKGCLSFKVIPTLDFEAVLLVYFVSENAAQIANLSDVIPRNDFELTKAIAV
jgi:hypothetical protein